MPSNVKSKKSQNKSKRALSTACWEQNDDGTLSLTIGPKKKNSADDTTASISKDSEQNAVVPKHDHNGNAISSSEMEVKMPPVVFKPPTLPIQILKASWSESGADYRMRQQTLRRKQMTAKYVLSFYLEFDFFKDFLKDGMNPPPHTLASLPFRMLDMCKIPPYDVPSEVWKTEEEKEPL